MTTLTEGRHAGGFIVSEANGGRSRETVTLAAAQDLEAGTVLGQILVGAATAAAIVGTGNATISAVTVSAGALPGAYTLLAIAATKLQLYGPEGQYLGLATAGSAATLGGLTFTVTAGGTPMVAGDSFTITVAAGSSAYAQFDQDGTDGTQHAAGILIYGQTTGESTEPGVILARDAEVNGSELTWPSDIETAEKAAGIAQLAALGVIVR
ncbi:head decoration protein [Thiocystis violacea]|uniref:head decoration protein n=1 Tax=Thiocystis violacea TaxID=13725 RepID=UPI00190370AC|nr:head decoration protein [Thiocystis violacea]MBK1719222.1 hypothetical protein [Thiocystis violacea]